MKAVITMIYAIPWQDIKPLAMVLISQDYILVIIPSWLFILPIDKQLKTIEDYKQLNPHYHETINED